MRKRETDIFYDDKLPPGMLPILNKYLVIRHLDESFVNIDIIKKKLKVFFLKYDEGIG